MEKILWDFTEKAADKAKVFHLYHLNSKHTVRTQCFNAPKMDFHLEEEKPVDHRDKKVWVVPPLQEIEDCGYTLKQAMMQRRTSWKFEHDNLSDKDVERFIAYSFGINDTEHNLKTYPSGGRLYPIDIYLIPTPKTVGSNQIFQTAHTLQYDVNTRELIRNSVMDLEKIDTLISATDIGTFSFKEAQFIVCLVGHSEKMQQKYHALTYRLMHDECGHIGQNIMLSAAMLHLSVVPLGGFFEDRIKSMLRIKEEDELLYVLAIG